MSILELAVVPKGHVALRKETWIQSTHALWQISTAHTWDKSQPFPSKYAKMDTRLYASFENFKGISYGLCGHVPFVTEIMWMYFVLQLSESECISQKKQRVVLTAPAGIRDHDVWYHSLEVSETSNYSDIITNYFWVIAHLEWLHTTLNGQLLFPAILLPLKKGSCLLRVVTALNVRSE